MNPNPPTIFQRNQFYVALSVALFVLACVTPCLEMSRKSDPVWYGLRILSLGWLGILVGQVAWFANPLWLISVLLLASRKWIAAIIFSGLALLVAANTLLLFVMPLPADESGMNKTSLERFRIGFYCWLASLAVPFVRACLMRTQAAPQPKPDVPPHIPYTH